MDVERLILPNGLVSADAGLCYVFSFGWRKGLFFDYGPLLHGDNRHDRDYDLGPVKAMIDRAAEKLPIDDQLEEISGEVSKVLSARLGDWRNDPIVSGHVEVLQRAYERFLENDFISAASILYPRIEGVMRTFGAMEHPAAGATQAELARIAAGSGLIREESLLLPHKFEAYLRDVYFASFKPGAMIDNVSRHTISHGVVEPTRLNRKATTVGFLILMQIVSTILVTRKRA
jgi:hypothetical protein